MDVHQEIINNTDARPVLTFVVKQFFDHFAHQANDKNKLPIELTNSTRTCLHNMNDDCLLAIFSIKSLTPMDLCSLAETCRRFKQITQRMFAKKFIIEADYNNYQSGYDAKDYLGRGKSTHDVERILKNFGSCLSAFPIDMRYDVPSDVLDLVAMYCASTLDRLKIYSVHPRIPKVLAIKLKPIFQRLLLLNIGCVATINGGSNIFANCNSLIELRICQVYNCYIILENIFPKLERFSFHYGLEDARYSFDVEQLLLNFISRHKSLKTINLDVRIGINYKLIFLQAIRNNCMELEELNITMTAVNEEDLFELRSLDQLRLLKIALRGRDHTECIPQLQALKSLETLTIANALDDSEFIPALAQLKNLLELRLQRFYGPRDFHQFALLTQLKKLHLNILGLVGNVANIIKKLTNLEELTIEEQRFVLDEKTFLEIVEIVKGRPKVLTLKCKFDSFYNLKNCDEQRKLRLINLV